MTAARAAARVSAGVGQPSFTLHKGEAEAIIHSIDKAVVSEASEIARMRLDLSYMPAPAAAPAAPAAKPK